MSVAFTLISVVFTGLVALFTGLLWKTTRGYAEVTRKLLEQSTEVFKQSEIAFKHERKAFQSNIISQMMLSAVQLAGNSHTREFSWSFVTGMADALKKIDSGTYKKVEQGLKAWREGKGGAVFEYILREVLEKKKT